MKEQLEYEFKKKLMQIGDLNLPYSVDKDGLPDYTKVLSEMSVDELILELKQQSFDSGYISGCN